METLKKIATLAALFLFGLTSISFAFGSSFSYAAFQQLISNYIVPFTTSTGYATELQSPVITSTASTTGTLSPGPLFIEIVATTQTGTSSQSNEYATTTSKNENINLYWPPVPGAQAYAIYFGTSTPGSEQAYFEATSTAGVVNTQYSLSSTSSPAYYTPAANGEGYYALIGSATTTITTQGLIQAISNATTTACSASVNVAIFYNTANSHLWLCTGSGPTWTVIK